MANVKPPNPFATNPLTSLPDLVLCKTPEPVETHEARKPLRSYLGPRVPDAPMPPATVSGGRSKGRPIVIVQDKPAEEKQLD